MDLIVWFFRTDGRRRTCRRTPLNRREILKLGSHLLDDLGFDAQGCPLIADKPGRFKNDKGR